jgi:hypothetical protein
MAFIDISNIFDYTISINKRDCPMPIQPVQPIKSTKTIKGSSPLLDNATINFDPTLAGRAVVEGLLYLKERLDWSGTKVAKILHLPANTVNTWLKNRVVPINSQVLHPDLQALIHLLAIHRSLEAMFDNPAQQRAWLTTHHPELNAIPEQLMGANVDGLIFTRQYLDYIRGRGA